MSGVFGCLTAPAAGVPHGLLDRMGRAMAHRDWFVVEHWADDTGAVGLGRVGIGIFNRAPQPVWSADGAHALVLAGELLDTGGDMSAEQAALALYAAHGAAFVQHLNGAFVLALWDARQQELLIANDRFGLYPLHYAHVGQRLLFAPELKALLCDPAVSRSLDMAAVAEYMRFQMLLGSKTFFSAIKLLTGGTLLRYTPAADRLTLERYWDFGHIPAQNPPPSFEDAVSESARLLRAAVHKRAAGRVGLYLSGGMDSRLLLGYAAAVAPGLATVTYGVRSSRDVAFAARLARRAGSDHHYLEFVDGRWVLEYADLHMDLTEGAHSWIHSHGISTLAQARGWLDINLSGLGGDPLAQMGVPLITAGDDEAFLACLHYVLLNKNTWPSLDEGEERLLYSPRHAARMVGLAFESLREEVRAYDHLDYERRAAAIWIEADRRMFQYYTIFGRSHIEQRFPFFDYDYFNFAAALPFEMDMDRRLRRAIILREMPALAAVPYDKDNLPIVQGERARKLNKAVLRTRQALSDTIGLKRPVYTTLYADYENWLRGELRAWGEDILLGEQISQRDLFNPRLLRSLWARHHAGAEVNFIGKLAPIMTFELFQRRFVDSA